MSGFPLDGIVSVPDLPVPTGPAPGARPASMLRQVDFDVSDDRVIAAPVETPVSQREEGYRAGHADAVAEREQLLAEVVALTTEVEHLREEVTALRRDRQWELDRANKAARLSADARDRADDLARQIETLREQVAIVEDDRTSRDAWAVRVGVRYDLPDDGDPYEAISRHLRKVVAQRNDYIIANASVLDVPFTNEPNLSPWSRSIKPAIDQLRIALGMRGAMRLPCCDLHNRNCEPPSELCCEHCTEAAHPGHVDGSVCIAPDLSSAPLDDPEATDG